MLGFSLARLTSLLPVLTPSSLVAAALRLERSWIGITQEKIEPRPRPKSSTLAAATQAFFAVPNAVVRSPRNSAARSSGSNQRARQSYVLTSTPPRTHTSHSSRCIPTPRSAPASVITSRTTSTPLSTLRLTAATLPLANIPTRSPFSDVFGTPIAFEAENESLSSTSSPSFFNLFPASSTPIKFNPDSSFISCATSEPTDSSNGPIFVYLRALRRPRPLRSYDPSRSDSCFSLRRDLVARLFAEKELCFQRANELVTAAEGMDAYDGVCFDDSTVSHSTKS